MQHREVRALADPVDQRGQPAPRDPLQRRLARVPAADLVGRDAQAVAVLVGEVHHEAFGDHRGEQVVRRAARQVAGARDPIQGHRVGLRREEPQHPEGTRRRRYLTHAGQRRAVLRPGCRLRHAAAPVTFRRVAGVGCVARRVGVDRGVQPVGLTDPVLVAGLLGGPRLLGLRRPGLGPLRVQAGLVGLDLSRAGSHVGVLQGRRPGPGVLAQLGGRRPAMLALLLAHQCGQQAEDQQRHHDGDDDPDHGFGVHGSSLSPSGRYPPTTGRTRQRGSSAATRPP